MTSFVVAIDGPAASGKGTLARRIAIHYGMPHLDTGLTYRAVAKALLDQGLMMKQLQLMWRLILTFIRWTRPFFQPMLLARRRRK